jgi:hypothetical protein
VELTVRNLAGAPRRARLAIEIAAFPRRRVLTVKQDLQPADRLELAGGWYDYVLGPYEFPPGASSLSLLPDGEPILIDDIEHTGDRRAASLALGRWHWLPASD